ncbi:MAG: hypothetical protein A2538_00775 [Candidatus Magasanikbacteria bacterium RIFOXYD2_FULL_41_14]|uniref:Uncharacterized protein n=1 Tax=Candidatus Magasanikbacteria bacterium RIFOXYD2_FULL_41_14 TaxID=1798709 RepID=A0A1F6PDS8_9BACT|nr:MAG: hypothetical protein A2538_00775 [Candidatus Magasanikbacteria bacterium RIFOXYD2_FULL_41_14]
MPEGEGGGNQLVVSSQRRADDSSNDQESVVAVDTRSALTTLTKLTKSDLQDADVAEILEVNWAVIENALREAITRIDLETGLETGNLQSTMSIVRLALRKLSVEDGEVRRMLEHYGEARIFDAFLFLFPGEIGKSAKRAFIGRERAYDLRDKNKKVRETVHALRLELSGVLDKKIHNKLLTENEAYRQLVKEKAMSVRTKEFRGLFVESDLDAEVDPLEAKLKHFIDTEKSKLYQNIK